MARHRVLLRRAERMQPREDLDGIAIELHVLAALDLNDLPLGYPGGAHHVGVGLRSDHLSTVFLAMRGMSAMWSQWPWPIRMWSAFLMCWSMRASSVARGVLGLNFPAKKPVS